MGPIIEVESVSINKTAALLVAGPSSTVRRVHRRRSARSDRRGVAPGSSCDVPELGADGLARRSCFVSQAWWTGPPPIHSPRATASHRGMTRPARRSAPRGTACGFWIRARGFREPAFSRKRPLAQPPVLSRESRKGGLDVPATHADATHFTANTRRRRSYAAFRHALVESESLSLMR
jgi:hypothetical protein